jgi:hypothetical protein
MRITLDAVSDLVLSINKHLKRMHDYHPQPPIKERKRLKHKQGT